MQIDEWFASLTDFERKQFKSFHYKENGYVQLVGIPYAHMKKHFSAMCLWIEDNNTDANGYIGLWSVYHDVGWWIFKSEEDAIKFKLVWGEC
jgi:hypothetical protein